MYDDNGITAKTIVGGYHFLFVHVDVMEPVVFHISAQDHVTYVSSVANMHVITNY